MTFHCCLRPLSLVPFVASVACGGEVDVLVRGDQWVQDAGSATGGTFNYEAGRAEGCEPGPYIGRFQGFWNEVLMISEVLEGPINFTLERTAEREFYQVTASEVVGRTGQDLAFRFRVDGVCRSGAFRADIVDGTAALFQFGGEVTGSYVSSERAFLGTWYIEDIQSKLQLVGGTWLAQIDARGATSPDAAAPASAELDD